MSSRRVRAAAEHAAQRIAPARVQDCTEWIIKTFRDEFILNEIEREYGVLRAVGHLYVLTVIDREYERARGLRDDK